MTLFADLLCLACIDSVSNRLGCLFALDLSSMIARAQSAPPVLELSRGISSSGGAASAVPEARGTGSVLSSGGWEVARRSKGPKGVPASDYWPTHLQNQFIAFLQSFKTRPCGSGDRCKIRDRCHGYHDSKDKRRPPFIVECRMVSRKLAYPLEDARNDPEKYYHPIYYKHFVCKLTSAQNGYVKGRYCLGSERCRFYHGDTDNFGVECVRKEDYVHPELGLPLALKHADESIVKLRARAFAVKAYKRTPCPEELCLGGDLCKHWHARDGYGDYGAGQRLRYSFSRYKTSECTNLGEDGLGLCHKGGLCSFAHGKDLCKGAAAWIVAIVVCIRLWNSCNCRGG